MKVLQLIDSLHTGGAERVAVNFANALVSHVENSYLCTTREEGLLKENISRNVHYLFLNKKSTIDFKAIKMLSHYIRANNIGIFHAHSSSFFLGTIIKILNPKIALIWHEHYGNREHASFISNVILKICSYFFSAIIAVNNSLKARSERKLLTKDVYVISNYPKFDSGSKETTLHGEMGKRIVCLANLRPDKDHINLLKAFIEVCKFQPDWSLHLIGHFYMDEYYKSIKGFIESNGLEKRVFIYGSCADAFHILRQSTIGVLSSKSEGLPLALLEYGLAKLPVVATNVGDCNQVISNKNEGCLVNSKNHEALAEALLYYIDNTDLRKKVAQNLHSKVLASFSESSILELLIKIYKKHQA